MKKIKFISLCVVLFTASIFTSCTTDVEPLDPAVELTPENPNNPEQGVLKVDFDGQTFVATTVQAVVNNTAIAISGLRASNGDFIQITLPAPLNQVGTYTWNDALAANTVLGLIYSTSGALGYVTSPQNAEFAEFPEYQDTATITISSIDMENKTISGTFQFTGGRFSDEGVPEFKNFTNGSFTNISFAGDITAPSDNSFFAKLDGADFNPATVTANKLTDLIYIIGKKQGVENISVVLPITAAPGTYEMDIFGDYKAIYIQDSSNTGTFNGDEGTLTIISHDTANKKIKGTFNFVGSSFFTTITHTITDGTFDVTYQ